METISLNDSNGSISNNINHYNHHHHHNVIDNDSIKLKESVSSHGIIERKDSKKNLIEISITTDNINSDENNNNNNLSIPKLFINDNLITKNGQDNGNSTQVSNDCNFQVLDSISSPSQLISESYDSSSSSPSPTSSSLSSSPPPNDGLYRNNLAYNKNKNSNNIVVNSIDNDSSNNGNNSNNNNNNYEINQNEQFNILNTSDLDKILSPSSSSSSSSSYSSSSSSSIYQVYNYPKSYIPYVPSNNNLEERIDALQIIKLIHFEYSKQVKDKATSLENYMYNINLNPQPNYNKNSNSNNNNQNISNDLINNNLIRNQKKLVSLSGDSNRPPRSPEETYIPFEDEDLSNCYSYSFIAPKVSKSQSNRHNSNQLANEKNAPKVVTFEKNEPGQFVFKKEKVPKLKDSNINHQFINNNIVDTSINSDSGSKNCIGFNPNNNNFNTVNGNNEDVDHYYDSFHNTELLDEDVLVYDDLIEDTLNDDDTVSVYTHDSSTSNFKISPIISPNQNQQANGNTSNHHNQFPQLQTNQSAMELTVPGIGYSRNGHNKKQHLRSLSHGIIKTPFTDNKLKTIQIFVPTEPYTCKLEITIEENVTVERLISEALELCIKEKRKIQYLKKQRLQSESNNNINNSNNKSPTISNNSTNSTGNNNNINNKNNIVSPPSSSIVSSSSTSPVTISNNGSGGSSTCGTSSINSSTNSASSNSNHTPTPTSKEFESLTFPFLIYTNHRDFVLRKSDENGDIDFCIPPIIRTTEIKKLTNDYFSLVIHPKSIRDLSNHPQIFRVYIEQSQKTQTSNGKPAEKTNNGIKNSVAVIYKSTSTLQSIKSSICKKEKLELNLCVFMTMNNEVIQNEKITLIELNLPSVKLVYDQHKQQIHKSVSFLSEVGNAPRPITKKLGPIFFFTPDNVCEIKQYVISKLNKLGVKKDRYMEINKDKIVYTSIDLPPPSMIPSNISTINNTLQPSNTLLQALQPQTTPAKNNKFFKPFSSKEIKTPVQMISEISGVGTVINKPSSFYLKCNGKTHEYYSSDADEIVAKIQFIIRSRKEKLI